MRELYDHYGKDKLLEVNEYREKLGGLNGAVACAADAALAPQSCQQIRKKI